MEDFRGYPCPKCGYDPEKTVLHDISLYAEPGQKLAFVGATVSIDAFGPIDSSDWNHVKSDVRESVQRYIYDTIKRNPMILPIIVEI